MAKSLVLYFSVYGTAKKVAEEIARLRGISAEEVIRVTRENAERLFALPRVL